MGDPNMMPRNRAELVPVRSFNRQIYCHTRFTTKLHMVHALGATISSYMHIKACRWRSAQKSASCKTPDLNRECQNVYPAKIQLI